MVIVLSSGSRKHSAGLAALRAIVTKISFLQRAISGSSLGTIVVSDRKYVA